jgi:protein-tyrosine phosphatase
VRQGEIDPHPPDPPRPAIGRGGSHSPPIPNPYPTSRGEILALFRQPLGRIWLRVLARLMEWLTDVQPKQLNYSDVTPQLAVGGAFRKRQIKRLRQRGVTAVVDCRMEAQDDPAALAQASIDFLHVPTPDRYGFTYGQMRDGVDWVLEWLSRSGRVFLHCEHGVGRGPLMACAVLVGQGYSAPEALRIVRSKRWQALPNDRQLAALLDFEEQWRRERPLRSVANHTSALDHQADVVGGTQPADVGQDVSST